MWQSSHPPEYIQTLISSGRGMWLYWNSQEQGQYETGQKYQYCHLYQKLRSTSRKPAVIASCNTCLHFAVYIPKLCVILLKLTSSSQDPVPLTAMSFSGIKMAKSREEPSDCAGCWHSRNAQTLACSCVSQEHHCNRSLSGVSHNIGKKSHP